MLKSILAALTLVIAILPAIAPAQDGQDRGQILQACRADAARLCEGRVRVAACLRRNRNALSDDCQAAIGGRAAQSETRLLRDVAYGQDPAQRMDLYVPAGAENAPILFMVHGGGWRTGSKSAAGVIERKAEHWLAQGFIVVSVDYRLLPEADPLEQAQDVARALAAAQRTVAGLGGDPDRFVLMGHSAGAHLVSLLNADPAPARRAGAGPWRGVVALDSAAYDVAAIMRDPHARLYDQAFGSNPAFWSDVSPSEKLKPGATPMLLVCSTKREDSCAQAEAFAKRASALGTRASVVPVAKTHAAINKDLGAPGAYTEAVDRFIAAIAAVD